MGQKLNPGDDTISAGEFNRHVDVADLVLGRQQLGTPGAPLRLNYDTNRVTVKNASGSDRRRGEILEITGCPLTDFSARELWLTGGSPTLANGFGVLLEPVRDGKFANKALQVDGVCIGLVNVTDDDHTHAVVESGEYVLQSAPNGPVRILHKPIGTGELTCALQLSPPLEEQLYAAVVTADGCTIEPGGLPLMTAGTQDVGIRRLEPDGSWGDIVSFGNTIYNPHPWFFDEDYVFLKQIRGLWVIDRPIWWRMPSCRATGHGQSGSGFSSWTLSPDTIVSNRGGCFELAGGWLRNRARNNVSFGSQLNVRCHAMVELQQDDAGDEFFAQVALNGPGGSTDVKRWRREGGAATMTFHMSYVGPVDHFDAFNCTVTSTPDAASTAVQFYLDVDFI